MNDFESLQLMPEILEAIRDAGYETPTDVQAAAIPAALEERDVLGCAQTGTGKTAAFALPILQRLASGGFGTVARRPLALVVAPTRELAMQIGEQFEVYGKHLDIKHVLIYGGVGQGRQVQALEEGVHVLVATPGRLLDLMGQNYIYLNRMQVFVLDEADRMMDMGFLPDIRKIIKVLPLRRQSMFFSATMPKKIVQLAEQLLYDLVHVDVSPTHVNVELIDQRVVFLDFAQRKPLLAQLIKAGDVGQAIVFTRTRRGAGSVADFLKRNDIDCTVVHGNKSQNARNQAMEAFRSEKAQVLVATDLAARGIDVDNVSHVFNFELPSEPEQYVHRIGRTGRAGAQGIAISFCTPPEREFLREIERMLGFEILPDAREPDPLPAPESTTLNPSPGERRPSGNRRRRRNRRGGRRATDRPEGEQSTEETQENARPTAAQRKAARNRRRRGRSKDD